MANGWGGSSGYAPNDMVGDPVIPRYEGSISQASPIEKFANKSFVHTYDKL
jgi:hypothetical protein